MEIFLFLLTQGKDYVHSQSALDRTYDSRAEIADLRKRLISLESLTGAVSSSSSFVVY
jgi:hypothetical protein